MQLRVNGSDVSYPEQQSSEHKGSGQEYEGLFVGVPAYNSLIGAECKETHYEDEGLLHSVV